MSIKMNRVVGPALVAAALCCGTGLPQARGYHGGAQRRDVSGTFDYYLLTLSWSPVFCATHSSDPQCGGSKRFGFVLHGLWPQLDSPRRLQHCSTSERLTAQAREFGLTVFPTEKLMVHEWQAHGVCSGMGALEYFQASDAARNSIKIPQQLEPGARTQSMTAAEVAKALRDANPSLTRQSLVVTCSGPELAEVRVCMSKDLQPVKCGSGVKNACRPGPIRVPGVR